MWSHANLGPRDVWGASTGTCKSAFAKFSIGVQAQAHPVFVPDRRAGCVHSFFWYWIYGRKASDSMCSPILCARTCSTLYQVHTESKNISHTSTEKHFFCLVRVFQMLLYKLSGLLPSIFRGPLRCTLGPMLSFLAAKGS